MSNYKWSNTSIKRLEDLHVDLRLILTFALERSDVDMIVVETHRPEERQFELFKKGRELIGGEWVVVDPGQVVTKIDGKNKKGKHNFKPSKAVDVCAYVSGAAVWSERYLCYLGGVITCIAADLYKSGLVKHRIRWGGNWDGDGEIITDQSFQDLPHYEIIE